MHLKDDLVLRILQTLKVVIVVSPGPGTTVVVTLNKDVLRRGTGSTDTIDGGLVQIEHQSLVHIVVFIVWEDQSNNSKQSKTTGLRWLGISLVSKMTLSLEANSLATVFQNSWKSEVEEMILPELYGGVELVTTPLVKTNHDLLSSIVMRIKNGISTTAGNELDGLSLNKHLIPSSKCLSLGPTFFRSLR